MNQIRLILTLLFILAFSTSALATDVLVGRYENADIYKTGKNSYRLDTGGDIDNVKPFEGSTDDYEPCSLVYADGVDINGGKFINTADLGYWIKLDQGFVRIYPVRGVKSKWIQIGSIPETGLTVNQINNKYLEVFKDKIYTRWSLYMNCRTGFKPEILLKSGYSGGDTFDLEFKLNNLTRSGKKIMDGETEVLRLSPAFLTDANNVTRDLSESFVGNTCSLTADLSGLTYPIVIDPTLTPLSASADTYIYQSAASQSTNYGSGTEILVRRTPTNPTPSSQHGIVQMDFSALPPGANITNVTVEMYLNSISALVDPEDRPVALKRLTITDPVELEATWLIYKTGSNWTAAGGDYSEDDKVTALLPATSTPQWMTWNPTAMFQYFQANDAEVANMFFQLDDAIDRTEAARYWSRNYGADPTKTPRGRIEYTLSNTVRIPKFLIPYYKNNR